MLRHEVLVRLVQRRLAFVAASVLGAVLLCWRAPEKAREIDHLVEYGVYALISVFASNYWALAGAYFAQALMLVALRWLYKPGERELIRGGFLFAIYLGMQIEPTLLALVFGSWLMRLLPDSVPPLPFRALLFTSVYSFGAIALYGREAWLKRTRVEQLPSIVGSSRALRAAAGVTAIGTLTLMFFGAPGQQRALLFSSAIVAAVALLRSLFLWKLPPRQLKDPNRQTSMVSEEWQRVVGALIVLTVLAPGIVTIDVRRVLAGDERDAHFARTRAEGSCDKMCAGDGKVSLFIVADTQFHELRGERTAAMLDLVDSVVPVATRPVELDLLSRATLAHFADVYEPLRKTGVKWTHLGDFADVACKSEIDGLDRYVGLFGRETLAALVPGNHDSMFVGNFLWHPDWPRACGASPILRKWESDEALRKLQRMDPGQKISHWNERSALARVIELGTLGGGKKVVGAFIDTSDYTGLHVGVAGVEGSVSLDQRTYLAGELDRYRDADVVFLFHHPYDTLSFQGRLLLEWLAKPLEGRLLGMVSAHTHKVGCRNQKLGNREVPELIVGSVTDPPQQAATLDVFGDGSLRLTTHHAVQRNAPSGAAEGLACEAVLADVRNRCKFEPVSAGYGCEGKVVTLPRKEGKDQLKLEQQWDAQQLLACIGIEHKCPLDAGSDVFDEIDRRVTSDRKTRDEWACLSWAASLKQGHKREGWTFRETIDFALEQSVAPMPKVMVVKAGGVARCLEDKP